MAIPSTRTKTVKVNSSRDRVDATLCKILGISFPPRNTIAIAATAIFRAANSMTAIKLIHEVFELSAREGSKTRANTAKTSWTINHPIARFPFCVCNSFTSARSRVTTTVLAKDIAIPKTIADGTDNPHEIPSMNVARNEPKHCINAPGIATRRTRPSSCKSKCKPTSKSSNTTPTSAN